MRMRTNALTFSQTGIQQPAINHAFPASVPACLECSFAFVDRPQLDDGHRVQSLRQKASRHIEWLGNKMRRHVSLGTGLVAVEVQFSLSFTSSARGAVVKEAPPNVQTWDEPGSHSQ